MFCPSIEWRLLFTREISCSLQNETPCETGGFSPKQDPSAAPSLFSKAALGNHPSKARRRNDMDFCKGSLDFMLATNSVEEDAPLSYCKKVAFDESLAQARCSNSDLAASLRPRRRPALKWAVYSHCARRSLLSLV